MSFLEESFSVEMASSVCQASALYEYQAKDDRLLNLQQNQNFIVVEKLSKVCMNILGTFKSESNRVTEFFH